MFESSMDSISEKTTTEVTPKIFNAKEILTYDDIELTCSCQNGRTQLLALFLKKGDLILYHLTKQPILKTIPWYKEPLHKPVAMAFNPSGSYLLILTSSLNLYLIPALVILDLNFKNDLPFDTADVTIYAYPYSEKIKNRDHLSTVKILYGIYRKSVDLLGSCILWWQSIEDCQQIAIIGTKTGAIYFVDLITGEKIGENQVEGEIVNLETCWDNQFENCLLLISTSAKEQFGLVLETKQQAADGKKGRSSDEEADSPKGNYRGRLQGLKQMSVEKLASIKTKFAENRVKAKTVIEEPNIGSKPYLTQAPESISSIRKNTYFSPQYSKGMHCITGFHSPSELLTVHTNKIESEPSFIYKLPPNCDDCVLADKLIYAVSKDRKSVYIVSAHLTETPVEPNMKFNFECLIGLWKASEKEAILKIYRSQNLANDWGKVPENWEVENLPAMIKETSSIVAPFLFVTTHRVVLYKPSDNPIHLILNLILNEYGLVQAEKLCTVFGIDISNILVVAGDIQLKKSKFSPALACYKLSQCGPLKTASKLAAYGFCAELLNFGTTLLFSNSVILSPPEQIHISNLVLMAFFNQILKTNTIALHKRFRHFLDTNEFYDKVLAVNLCGQSLLFDFLQKLIVERGLIIDGAVVIGKLIEKFQQDEFALKAAKNDDFWTCISDPNLRESLLIRKDDFVKYSQFITKNLNDLSDTFLERFCNIFDPRHPSLRTLARLGLSSDSDDDYVEFPLNQLVQSFLQVLLVKISLEETAFDSSLILPVTENPKFLNTREDSVESVDGDAIWAIRKDIKKELGIKVNPLSCGFGHVALIRNGFVYTWGNNSKGCIGQGFSLARHTTPEPIMYFGLFRLSVSQLSCGRNHTVALTNNGVYAWGSSQFGQLGLKEIKESPHPRHVTSLIKLNIVSIACGQYHTLFLTSSGCVFACGWSVHGQLGLGSVENVREPRHLQTLQEHVVTAIAAGYAHSIVLTATGNVYAFGSNVFGQLGSGKSVKSPFPILVKGITGRVINISTNYFHNLALTISQSVYTWGLSPQVLRMQAQTHKKARLGQESSSTLEIRDCEAHLVPSVVDTKNVTGKIAQLACGCHHSALVTENGSLYLWGRSLDGQLGNGNRAEVVLPTQLASLQVQCVALGCDFTLVQEKGSGKLFAWGSNAVGQLGVPLKETNSKLFDGKMIMVKSTKRMLRIPNCNNSVEAPIEVPNIPSAVFTYHPLKDCLNSENTALDLKHSARDWHQVLQMFLPVLSPDLLLCKCLHFGNHQAAAKLLLLQGQIKASLINQLKALPSNYRRSERKEEFREDLKTPDSEIHLFTIQGGQEEMCHVDEKSDDLSIFEEDEKKLYDEDEFMKLVKDVLLNYLNYAPDHSGDILEHAVDFWIEKSLPIGCLENFFELHLDRLYYDLGVLLYCGKNNNLCKRFSTKFTLSVTARLLHHVENKQSCPEFLSVLSRYLNVDNDSVADLSERLRPDYEGGIAVNWPNGNESKFLYVFSCGHSYTQLNFSEESKKFSEAYLKLDTEECFDMVCPSCVCNILNVQSA